jgi:hypothetical protein
MNKKAIIAACLALSGIVTLGAIERPDSVWVEPISSAFGFAKGTPRLIAGVGFPVTGPFAADVRALVEWNNDSENGFFQIKSDTLVKWYAFATRTRDGNLKGFYLGAGLGLGFAKVSGDEDISILAGGPIAETGTRIVIGSLPAFVEPFVAISLVAGPRFGGENDFRFTVSPGAGLRVGYSF